MISEFFLNSVYQVTDEDEESETKHETKVSVELNCLSQVVRVPFNN